jgi:hypothetical protein
MAFDFRKLRSAYSGDAIRVLRTSDNTEQDFGFVANEVVGSDIVDFVGWNLWSYSEELQQSVWTKTNFTVTTNTIVAPDGNTTADALLETAISGSFTFSRTGAVVSGTNYNYSFWFQPINGREFVRISFGTQLNSATVWINMSTGTIASQTGFNSMTITAVSGGWYFVDINITATSNGTPNMSVNTSENGSSISYAGDVTKGISIWGLQRTESLSVLYYDKTEANPRGYGSISKGYDQVSGGDDLINATIIRQPLIVNNGNLITDNGKLALQGGSNLGLRTAGTITMSGYTNLLITFGVNVTNVATNQILFELSSIYTSNNGSLAVRIQSGVVLVSQRITSGQFTEKTYPISTGRQLITVRFRTGQTATDASQVWINGVEITGTVTGTNNSITLINQVLYFFARNTNASGFLGKYQNLTMFTDEAQRTGIENNINDYHGYY